MAERAKNPIPGLELAKAIVGVYGINLNDPDIPARTRNAKIAASEEIEALLLAELKKHRGKLRRKVGEA